MKYIIIGKCKCTGYTKKKLAELNEILLTSAIKLQKVITMKTVRRQMTILQKKF